MGNEQQKPQQNGDITISINHPKFQSAKLITQSKQKQLQITMGVDQKQYEKWKLNTKKVSLDPTFLLLPKKQQFARKGFCGDSGTLKINYDNYSYLLTEEIYNRNGKKTTFQQPELWYLLLSLSSAQQQVKRKTGGKVGDIRPHNIFLNAEGQAKVSCMHSWPRQVTNFNKTFDNEKTYLAPEDMVRLQMGTLQDSNTFQGEVFSIGLTLLSAAMLQDFLNLYNTKTYKFNLPEATALLTEWKLNTIYSQIFTAVVSNLCQFKPEKRLDDDQLWKWISQFQTNIRHKQDFFIESAPPKIQLQLEQIRKLQNAQDPQLYHQEQAPQVHPQSAYPDKSVVQTYNPPKGTNFQNQPQRYTQPIVQSKQPFVQQPLASPRSRNLQNIPNLPPQIRTTGYEGQFPTSASKQVVYGNLPPQLQQRNTLFDPRSQPFDPRSQPFDPRTLSFDPRNKPFDPRNLAFDPRNPSFNPRSQIPQQRTPVFQDQRFFNPLNPDSPQTKLPPQLVGRTINQKYIGREGEPITYHQGYVPPPTQYSPVRDPRQVIPGGRVPSLAEGQRLPQSGLSYFQNVIDPQGAKGGRIQETVYIQRPDYISGRDRQQ